MGLATPGACQARWCDAKLTPMYCASSNFDQNDAHLRSFLLGLLLRR